MRDRRCEYLGTVCKTCPDSCVIETGANGDVPKIIEEVTKILNEQVKWIGVTDMSTSQKIKAMKTLTLKFLAEELSEMQNSEQ